MKLDGNVDAFLDEIGFLRTGITIGVDENGNEIKRNADIIDYVACMIKYGYYDRGHERSLFKNAYALSRPPYKNGHSFAARASDFVFHSKDQLFDYDNDVLGTTYTINGKVLSRDERIAIYDSINESRLPNKNYRVFTAALRRAANGYELIPESARSEQSHR